MSDEQTDAVLLRAARAYRERHDGSSPDAARTRARILASRERDQRTTMAIAAAAVLAIGVGVPTAWAWSTGRLAHWLEGDAPSVGEGTTGEPTREVTPEESAPGTPALADEPVHGAPIAPADPEPGRPGTSSSAPEPTPSAAPTPAPDESAIDERDPVDPTERRAYREAHALHFDAHDPAGALAAWDRYLAAYPTGRFAIEARYNRALCLVRLDRPDPAREALAPFAEGRHGEYRRREATALIEALAE